jgi:hypothetical protein
LRPDSPAGRSRTQSAATGAPVAAQATAAPAQAAITAIAAPRFRIRDRQIPDRDGDRRGVACAGLKCGDKQPAKLVVSRQGEIVAQDRDVLLHDRQIASGQDHVSFEADRVPVLRGR